MYSISSEVSFATFGGISFDGVDEVEAVRGPEVIKIEFDGLLEIDFPTSLLLATNLFVAFTLVDTSFFCQFIDVFDELGAGEDSSVTILFSSFSLSCSTFLALRLAPAICSLVNAGVDAMTLSTMREWARGEMVWKVEVEGEYRIRSVREAASRGATASP
jgi:hypothetical protein